MPNIFDFNPTNINPFPYWKWNKVLPAVYDDSLSQYEILCKLLYKVNDIITNSNSIGEQVELLTQLVQQLIDGEFPSGIVDYVNEIVAAAIAEDVGEINDLIASMQQTLADYDTKLTNRRESGLVPAGTIQALYECGMSYVGKDIVYKHKADASNGWDYVNGPEWVQDAYGNYGYAMNCITFVNLVMAGVPYEASMYNLGIKHNVFGKAGYCFSAYNDPVTADNYTLYDTTSKLAQRLLDLGLAEYTNADYTNVRAGDIVFWLMPDNPDQLAYHCAIVLGGPYCEYNELDDTNAMFMCMECYNVQYTVRVRGITGYDAHNNHLGIVAHIPFGSVIEHPTRLITTIFDTATGFQVSSDDMGLASGTLTLDYDLKITGDNPAVQFWTNGYLSQSGGNPIQATTIIKNNRQLESWQHHTVLINTRYSGAQNAWAKITSLRAALTDCEMKNIRLFKGIGTIEDNTMPILTTDSLAAIQADIERFAVNSEHIRAYQEMHYIIPVHTTAAIAIGSFTTGQFLYMLDCLVRCSSSVFSIDVTSKGTPINGHFSSGTWTWD